MTTTVATLDTALQAVTVALKQLAADSAGDPSDPGYWSRRAAAETRCADALSEQVGARLACHLVAIAQHAAARDHRPGDALGDLRRGFEDAQSLPRT